MNCKCLFLLILLPAVSSLLFANTDIYEYQEAEELIENFNDEVEAKKLQVWDMNKILLNYKHDFIISPSDQIFFQAKGDNSETLIHKREEEEIRLFANYQTSNYNLGFGYYRPTFGLGNIYLKNASKDYLNRILSRSKFDLQGVFSSYEINSLSWNLFYSKSDLNTTSDILGKERIVYYESEKSSWQHAGMIMTYEIEDLTIGLLTAHFASAESLEQLDYKKESWLLANYLKYHNDKLLLEYEVDYQFSDFIHSAKAQFTSGDLATTWLYKSIPDHSLNWLNSGISNKYNRNTTIYSGDCTFQLVKLDFSLGSELKSNSQNKQWRSKSFVKTAFTKSLKYQITQEIYRDYQASKHQKYSHKFTAELFKWENNKIIANYTCNNKKQAGRAYIYQIEFKSQTDFGKLKLSLKALDNFKNEEIVQDLDASIIASFYDISEDLIIFFNYQTPEFKNFLLSSALTHSLYNHKLNSLKIELNYRL